MIIPLDNMRLIHHDLFGDFGQAMVLLEFKADMREQIEEFASAVFAVGQNRWPDRWHSLGQCRDRVALPFAQDQEGRLQLYAYAPASSPPLVLDAMKREITTYSGIDSMDLSNVSCIVSLCSRERFDTQRHTGRQQFAIHAHLRALSLKEQMS